MRKLGLIAILLAASSAALAQPKPPNLSVVTEGTHLEVYWNPVIDADGYTLYYAPYPAADPIFRLNLDAGNHQFVRNFVRGRCLLSCANRIIFWRGKRYLEH